MKHVSTEACIKHPLRFPGKYAQKSFPRENHNSLTIFKWSFSISVKATWIGIFLDLFVHKRIICSADFCFHRRWILHSYTSHRKSRYSISRKFGSIFIFCKDNVSHQLIEQCVTWKSRTIILSTTESSSHTNAPCMIPNFHKPQMQWEADNIILPSNTNICS